MREKENNFFLIIEPQHPFTKQTSVRSQREEYCYNNRGLSAKRVRFLRRARFGECENRRVQK